MDSARPRPSMSGVAAWCRSHTDWLAVAAILTAGVVMTRGVGPSEQAYGLVEGASVALPVIGMVLIYRASRIINFAQLQMGAVAGQLFTDLGQHRTVQGWVGTFCGGCADSRWADALAWWVSAVLSVALAAALVWLFHRFVLRRFGEAPRLILTILTIAGGAFITAVGGLVIGTFFSASQSAAPSLPAPLPLTMRIAGVTYTSSDMLTLIVALVAAGAVAWMLVRTRTGIALRGVADNAVRAQTLGIDSDAIAGRAWLIAGVLSGVASVLAVSRVGFAAGSDAPTLLRVLAAVAASLVSVRLAVVAALVIGVVDNAVSFSTSSPALSSVLLLGFIVVVLVFQHEGRRRTDEESLTWLGGREMRPIPAELRRLRPVRATLVRLGVLAAVVVLGFPWFMTPSDVVVASSVVITGVVAMSLLVLTGWAGQISIGQLAFAALGGWCTAVVAAPFPINLLVGGLAGAGLATLAGLPSLRLRGLQLAITTLALATAAGQLLLGRRYLGALLPSSVARPSFLGVSFDDERAFFYLTLAVLVLVVAAIAGVRRSRTARALIAAKDNETGAQAFGINLLRARLGAFAFSGFVAAIGGGLSVYLAHAANAIDFTPDRSLFIFLVVIVGGVGSVAGPILGALYLLAYDLLSGNPAFALPASLFLSPGLGVTVLLLLAPGGLSQLLYGARDAWLRRVADRHHIVVPSLVADRRAAGDRAPIKPNLRPSGTPAVVPAVYRLPDQWGVEPR